MSIAVAIFKLIQIRTSPNLPELFKGRIEANYYMPAAAPSVLEVPVTHVVEFFGKQSFPLCGVLCHYYGGVKS